MLDYVDHTELFSPRSTLLSYRIISYNIVLSSIRAISFVSEFIYYVFKNLHFLTKICRYTVENYGSFQWIRCDFRAIFLSHFRKITIFIKLFVSQSKEFELFKVMQGHRSWC